MKSLNREKKKKKNYIQNGTKIYKSQLDLQMLLK